MKGQLSPRLWKLAESLQTAVVRRCYSQHACEFCDEPIKVADLYADRGAGRRGHYRCVPGLGKEWPKEVLWQYGDLRFVVYQATATGTGVAFERREPDTFGGDSWEIDPIEVHPETENMVRDLLAAAEDGP